MSVFDVFKKNKDNCGQYIEQSANELCYYFLEDPPYYFFNQLNVIDSCKVEAQTFDIEAMIIGGSHVVKIVTPNKMFCEVLACGQKIDTYRLKKSFADFDGYYRQIREEVRYGIQIDVFNKDNPANSDRMARNIKLFYEDVEAGQEKDNHFYMKKVFKKRTGNFTPETVVIGFVVNDFIRYKTLHGYPNDNVVVITDTWLGNPE